MLTNFHRWTLLQFYNICDVEKTNIEKPKKQKFKPDYSENYDLEKEKGDFSIQLAARLPVAVEMTRSYSLQEEGKMGVGCSAPDPHFSIKY